MTASIPMDHMAHWKNEWFPEDEMADTARPGVISKFTALLLASVPGIAATRWYQVNVNSAAELTYRKGAGWPNPTSPCVNEINADGTCPSNGFAAKEKRPQCYLCLRDWRPPRTVRIKSFRHDQERHSRTSRIRRRIGSRVGTASTSEAPWRPSIPRRRRPHVPSTGRVACARR